MSYSSFGIEKGQLIRVPATANLMVDSKDRGSNNPSPFDFQISRPQSLIQGYFTRIGTTEVVLEWCDGNIYKDNFLALVDISGSSTAVSIPIPLALGGFYTVEDALDQIIDAINNETGSTGVSIAFANTLGSPSLIVTGGHILFQSNDGTNGAGLAEALGITPLDVKEDTSFVIDCPDLRHFRYLDFVSTELTALQDVKDSSTAPFVRDVLCRWYMSEDNQEEEDGFGFPILMGYKQFKRRRIFNPPKQIKWEQTFPVGNLSFKVFGDDGNLPITLDFGKQDPNIQVPSKSQLLLTLQLSEG